MHRIAVLTNSMAQEAFLAEQLLRFCAEHCLFPQMDCYRDQESFFEAAHNEPLTNALIALPGVDGLNAVEQQCRRMPGCCAVGSAPALGAGGREFESRHSDTANAR